MALNPTRPSSMLPPLAGVGLFLSLVWGGLFAFVQHDRALVEEAAYREAENYSIAFEEYTHNIITTVDNSLRYLSQLYVQSRLRGQPMDQVLLEGYAPIKTFQFAIIGPGQGFGDDLAHVVAVQAGADEKQLVCVGVVRHGNSCRIG